MNRIISVITVVIIFACLMVCVSCKNDKVETDGVFNYTLLEDGTYSISAANIDAVGENLVIPLSFNDKYVTRISEFGFRKCNNLVTVELPEELTGVEEGAFAECKNLTTVYVKSTKLNWLGLASFGKCTDLNAIHYLGTKEMWKRIMKRNGWNSGSDELVIYCSNGSIK